MLWDATARSVKAAEHQSNSFHSDKPEDTESRKVGMHDGARGGFIVYKVNIFLEKKKKVIPLILREHSIS